MSTFEFVSVSVAIVLAMTLGRLMSAAGDVFDKARRDPVHIGFYILSFAGIMTTWWAQWLMASVESWTFLEFIAVMASPITLHFLVNALLSSNPSEVTDWRDYFDRNRIWFFSALLALTLMVAVRRWFLSDDTAITFFLALQAVVLIWPLASASRLARVAVLITWGLSLVYAVSVQYTISG
jgi:hypothetical protein